MWILLHKYIMSLMLYYTIRYDTILYIHMPRAQRVTTITAYIRNYLFTWTLVINCLCLSSKIKLVFCCCLLCVFFFSAKTTVSKIMRKRLKMELNNQYARHFRSILYECVHLDDWNVNNKRKFTSHCVTYERRSYNMK